MDGAPPTSRSDKPTMTTQLSNGAAQSSRSAFASLRTSVWSKPIARVLLLVAGLAILGIVGRAAGARADLPAPPAVDLAVDAGANAAPAALLLAAPGPCSNSSTASGAPPSFASPEAPVAAAATRSRRDNEATAEDPVVLNTATASDLRRLPGVGAKRAEAIIALRARLGRFRQLEDLLRVRGIGRATLRRLRPVVRLEPRPEPPPQPGAATPPPL